MNRVADYFLLISSTYSWLGSEKQIGSMVVFSGPDKLDECMIGVTGNGEIYSIVQMGSK
ncbi:hypothetical protein [Brevibacillus laterosporus]|nr:hypothetical protein [Brevibacillus laterosporus]MED1665472.1 hypothetical protein [Brevibacillus laterosporus]MED1671287.1 hypothetical protein [Brevibacillus laterosporus]MED1721076.1 hypothetical protein [Brevibacillus laterosporus]